MKDLTLKEFCHKYLACAEGYEYGKSLTDKKEQAMMGEVWPRMDNRDYMLWVISQERVLTKRERVALSVRFIKETHLADGRTVYDLLTDQRSIDAIAVCEAYVRGEASDAAWDAARAAASAAASAAAWYAARAAASDAACDAASAAASDAASAAARAEQVDILHTINPFLDGGAK